MSSLWTLSLVMIVPADLREAGNRVSCALGHDVMPGDTFSVPLSSGGAGPATHYGCRATAKPDFAAMLASAGSGSLPEIDWSAYGLTLGDVSAVLGALIVDIRPAEQAEGHFEDVLAASGLTRVVPPDPSA